MDVQKENPSLKIWMDSSLSFIGFLLNGIKYSGPVSVRTYFGEGAQYYRGTIDSIDGNGLDLKFYQIIILIKENHVLGTFYFKNWCSISILVDYISIDIEFSFDSFNRNICKVLVGVRIFE